MPRIASLTFYNSITSAITQSQQRVLQLQQQIATGKAIQTPSDDPVGTGEAMWFQEQIRSNDQYQKNLSETLSGLSATDSSLSQIQDLLGQVGSIQTSGADDSLGADARKALASQLNGIIQSLVQQGNSQYAGLYVFGGQKTTQAPLQVQQDAQGNVTAVTYQTAGGAVAPTTRAVAQGVTVKTNVTLPELFGGNGDVFNTLINLRNALQGNDGATVRGVGDTIGKMQDTVSLASTYIGSLENRVTSMQNAAQQQAASYEEGRSQAEDLPEAQGAVDLQAAQTALQAALASGASILNLSLLDYMK